MNRKLPNWKHFRDFPPANRAFECISYRIFFVLLRIFKNAHCVFKRFEKHVPNSGHNYSFPRIPSHSKQIMHNFIQDESFKYMRWPLDEYCKLAYLFLLFMYESIFSRISLHERMYREGNVSPEIATPNIGTPSFPRLPPPPEKISSCDRILFYADLL